VVVSGKTLQKENKQQKMRLFLSKNAFLDIAQVVQCYSRRV
jgi:hypothetical protein